MIEFVEFFAIQRLWQLSKVTYMLQAGHKPVKPVAGCGKANYTGYKQLSMGLKMNKCIKTK